MPATRNKTIRLSHDLFDAIELIAKKQGYPNATALWEGMARYSGITQPSHSVSLPWAKESPATQDALDEAVKIMVVVGKGMSAAQLKQLTTAEIIERAQKAKAENPNLFP